MLSFSNVCIFVISGIGTSLQTLICNESVTSMVGSEDNMVVEKSASMGVVNAEILNTLQTRHNMFVFSYYESI